MGVDPNVAIIGAGPAGLMAAEVLLAKDIAVNIFEAKPTIGRKLLMAGKSGLNITHTENFKLFLSRFSSQTNTLEDRAGTVRERKSSLGTNSSPVS